MSTTEIVFLVEQDPEGGYTARSIGKISTNSWLTDDEIDGLQPAQEDWGGDRSPPRPIFHWRLKIDPNC